MNGALPLIDFSGFGAGDAADRQAIGTAIGSACREAGFFYLEGHGIDPTLTANAFAASRQFFALPPAEKAKVAIENSACHRGWFALGGEVLDAAQQPTGDYKEGIKIGCDLSTDHPRVQAETPLHGPNQWPELAGWQDTMQAYYDACAALSRQLMQAFALSLGLEDSHFDADLSLPMATLGPLYYPPRPQDEAILSAGAHTDFGCLTLLAQDGVPGLEVQDSQGAWHIVPPRADTLVVNIGDMLARWTNDLYASTRHRVVNRTDQARYSMAFFFDPDPEADLAPLPGCLASDATAHYPPATCLSHLLQKIEESFAYRQTS